MSDSPSPTGSSEDTPTNESEDSRLYRWSRRGLRLTVGLLLSAFVLVGLLLVALQTETGATTAARYLASTVNPLPNTELTVERASGNWVRSLELTNVSLVRPDSTSADSTTMAHVDTVSVRYSLGALLRGRVHLSDVSLQTPSVRIRQAADSTWDWARMLRASASASPDTSADAGWPIRIDRFRVSGGALSANFYTEGRDSTAHVRRFEMQASGVDLAPTFRGRLDTLGLEGQLPADTTTVRLTARGGLTPNRIRLDTLNLTSPRSYVRGRGSARVPSDPSDSLDDVDLTIDAEPLVLGDLTPLIPTLDVNPTESITLTSNVSGSDQLLTLTADATFSTGGTLTARAKATPRTTGGSETRPFRYQLDAEIQEVSTSLLGPKDRNQQVVTASIDGSLRGPTLRALDGHVNVDVRNSRYGPFDVQGLTMRSSFTEGTASIDASGHLNGTDVTLSGTTRPFDEAPSIDLTAHVEQLSLATALPAADIDGTLTGKIRARGSAVATPQATYDVTTTLGPSQIGAQPVETGTLSFSAGPTALDVDGSFTFPSGHFALTGRATLDGSERFTIERARFDNVNVAALLGDTTDSRVTGRLTARGEGLSPETMKAEGSLSLEQGHYAQYRIQTAETSATLNTGRLSTETEALVNGGHWTVEITSRPFAPTFSAEITRGRFENVDIGPLLQDTTQSSALHGRIQGRVEGTAASDMRLEGQMRLDTSRVNRQNISSASADLSLRDGALESSVDVEGPVGSAQFVLEARPFDDRPVYHIPSGSFEKLDVGAFAGIPSLSTQLSGSLALRAEGTELSTLSLDSELLLDASTINDADLTEGRLTASGENGRLSTEGQFSVSGGSVSLTGETNRSESTPSYTVQTKARSLDVGALAGFDSTQVHLSRARWSVQGQGTTLDSLSVSSDLAATAVQIGQLQVDTLTAAGTLDRGLLAVDTLSVRSNVVEGQGQGTIAVTRQAGTSNFDVQADVIDLAPLRTLLDARVLTLREGSIEAHIYGATGEQRFDGRATVDGFIYDDLRLGKTNVSFNGQRGTDQTFERLAVEGETGYVSYAGVSATRTRLDGQYDGTDVDVSANVVLDGQRRADVAAKFDPAADPMELQLGRLDVRLGPDEWSLEQPTVVTLGDTYEVDQFTLLSGDQRIEADGVLAFEGGQSLEVTTENVRLGGIAPLVGLGGLDGELTSRLAVTGSASTPQIDGYIDMTLRSEDTSVGSLELEAQYENLTTSLDARLVHTDGSVLTANGSIPMDLRLNRETPADVSDRPVQVNAATEKFPINWIDPFLDPATVRSVSGTLNGSAAIEGTLDQPELSGAVQVLDAGAYVTPLETTYRDGSIQLRLKDDRVTIENGRLRSSNGGTLRTDGTMDFPDLTAGEYNLNLEASNLLAIDTRAYREVVVDGSVRLQGTTRRPELSGNVQVERGDVYYSAALAEATGAATQVPLSNQDQLVLEERFGVRLTAADTTTFDFYEASTLDLSVQIRRDTWVRSTSNPEMNVQFSGSLDLQKAPNEDPQIFGTIDVLEGQSTVRQFSQEFEISEGTLTFNGDPYSPRLDLTAVYEQRARGTQGSEVQITLTLSGRPNNLTPSLSSEPSMSTRNILSYLATGRPADNLFGGGTEGGNMATRMALGQASNFVENLAASELGLDLVRLDIRAEGVSYLTVGRYFNSQFFAAIEQPLITSAAQTSVQSSTFVPDVTLEYEFTDYLRLRSLSGQQSLQLHLIFEYAY